MRYLKKSLGQNFLIDKNIIRKIVNLVDIKNKNVIEIEEIIKINKQNPINFLQPSQ